MSGATPLLREAGGEIEALRLRGDFHGLMAIIRECALANPRIFALPEVKAWCGRRWRHLFLREAIEDQKAFEVATQRSDKRPPRQRIAERYLARDQEAWRDEQPDPIESPALATTLLLCPGLLNGLMPEREFRDDLRRLEWRYRMRAIRSDSHPARSCEANTLDIIQALSEGRGLDALSKPIPETQARAPGNVLVLAYSKGAADILTTLVAHPEIRNRIKCIVTWAGAIGGSPLADEAQRKLKPHRLASGTGAIRGALSGFARWKLTKKAIARYRLEEYDAEAAIRDLTTNVRREFLAQNSRTLDVMGLPIFTFRGVTSRDEVPWSQRYGAKLLSSIEAEHDMHVPGSCSKLPLPLATELAVFRGHHWDLAYPAFTSRRWMNRTYHPFPKTAALAATLQLALELGLIE